MKDHDQRFKALIREFLPEFFQLFFPQWADRFDFLTVEWLDQEVFTDPPQGERRFVDLVAKLGVTQAVASGKAESWIVLIHIEIESADSVAPLRPRMFGYYESLRRRHDLPVMPIGLLLRVGLDGIGWDVYEEYFWEQRLLRFEYAYIGLPALDGEAYLTRENVLALALLALMRLPEERKVEIRAEALQRTAISGQNDYRRFLIAECLQAYLPLSVNEMQVFRSLLTEERFKEAKIMTQTYFEEGRLTGYEQGRKTGFEQGRQTGVEEAQREVLKLQLEERFGPLGTDVQQRIDAWPADKLTALLRAAIRAQSLKELGLEG